MRYIRFLRGKGTTTRIHIVDETFPHSGAYFYTLCARGDCKDRVEIITQPSELFICKHCKKGIKEV